jgi:hypothetical protein
MAINTLKFAEGDFTDQDISSLPDRPASIGMTAAQLKARFDNIGKVMLALGNYNLLIDALQSVTDGNSGADNIAVTAVAGATGLTVQEVLETLGAVSHTHANKALLDTYTQTEADLARAVLTASTFIHIQMTPSAEWGVTHNLAKYPSVVVVDTTGRVCVGDIKYEGVNSLTLTFSAGFAGKAYLN